MDNSETSLPTVPKSTTENGTTHADVLPPVHAEDAAAQIQLTAEDPAAHAENKARVDQQIEEAKMQINARREAEGIPAGDEATSPTIDQSVAPVEAPKQKKPSIIKRAFTAIKEKTKSFFKKLKNLIFAPGAKKSQPTAPTKPMESGVHRG